MTHDPDATIRSTSTDESVGTTIGRYKVQQVIGEGGFGTVYLAEQAEPVRRQVALKIIKLGMDTKQVIARFEAERQALALMDHPNIAKVLDAGATEQGRSYFVMELVRGEPITTYCDEQSLNTRQRLGLFIDVCHAVQHAHQKGIIHRDLKPSNVLISVQDGKPIPKVIDFGIAKATGGRLTEKTLVTEMRQLVGTPEYMSPEQASMSGVDIDTRSDIYSLGVLLYELLAGTTPYGPGFLRAEGMQEVLRMIRDEDPRRPSHRLSELSRMSTADDSGDRESASIETIATARRTDPAHLRRELKGDLDWIVMKCLEKDRNRRYETANGLARDIERYFASEPVTAGPPGMAYRTRKFVRRNRALVSAAAAVTLVLMLGIAGTTTQLIRARRQATKAAIVNEFLREIIVAPDPVWSFAQPNPDRRTGPELTVADALFDMLPLIDEHFTGYPEAEADVRLAIGKSFNGLSHFTEAEEQLSRAMMLFVREHGEDDPRTRECMRVRGWTMMWLGRQEMAEELYTRALQSCRRTLGESHPETVESKIELAKFYMDKFGNVHVAEELCRAALASLEQAGRENSWDALQARAVLAFALNIQSDHDASLPLALRTYDEVRQQQAQDSGLANFLQMTIGNIYFYGYEILRDGDPALAEKYYRDAFDLSEQLAGKDSFIHATSNQLLANALIQQRRWEEAEQRALFAYETHRENLGPRHGYTETCWHRLVAARMAQEPDDAERRRQFQASSQHDAQRYASESLSASNNLAAYFIEIGRREDAIAVLEWAEPLVQETIRQSRPEAIRTRALLGTLLAEDERCNEVIDLFREADELRARMAPDAFIPAEALSGWGVCEMQRGDLASAEMHLTASHDAFVARGDAAGAATAAARLAELYEAWGKSEEAARWRAVPGRVAD